eukprot:4455147-Heterocapsa_arctica.AAC.1
MAQAFRSPNRQLGQGPQGVPGSRWAPPRRQAHGRWLEPAAWRGRRGAGASPRAKWLRCRRAGPQPDGDGRSPRRRWALRH